MLAVTQYLARQRPDTAKASEGWQPLLTLVEKETISFAKQQGLGEPSDDKVLRLLQSINLARQDGRALYAHLNKTLRGTAVRVVIGVEVRGKEVVSYVDFRSPADILHPDSDNPDQMITCARAVKRHGYELCEKLSGRLPCIAVLMQNWRDQYKGEPEKSYRTYPLECCWYQPEDGKGLPGDRSWPPVSITNATGMCQLAVPFWLADALAAYPSSSTCDCQLSSQSQPAAAATADAAASSSSITSAATGEATCSSSGSGAASSPDHCESTATSYAQSNSYSTAAGDDADEPLAPQYILRNSFNVLCQSLLPTAEEGNKMSAAVKGVQDAVTGIARGKPWKLQDAQPVGSFKRQTSLRGSHDLDLQLMLNVDEYAEQGDLGSFTSTRRQCLDDLSSTLCGPPANGAKGDPRKLAKSGWRQLDRTEHCLFLRHEQLKFELDVQVYPSLHMALGYRTGGTSRQQALLQVLIERRKIALGLEAATESAADLAGSDLCREITCPDKPSRLRAGFLTPLMTEAVKGTEDRFSKQYGFKSAGMMATKVMRVLKALSINGFAQQQLQSSSFSSCGNSTSSSSSSTSPTSSAAFTQSPGKQPPLNPKTLRPPGYIWEILVMVVFEQQCQLGPGAVARYSQGGLREFHLFMDVLLAASQRLQPADASDSAPAEPIALYLYYTKEECELCRPLWTVDEPVGRQCTPIIIHPADPSFNCTAHSVFTKWAELADFAGQLHQKLQAALDGTSEQAEAAAQHLERLTNKQPGARLGRMR